MFPPGTLKELARRREALRHRIAADRERNGANARRVLQPLSGIDEVTGFWRHLPPAVRLVLPSAGAALLRTLWPQAKALHWLLAWGPAIGAVFRSTDALRAAEPPLTAPPK